MNRHHSLALIGVCIVASGVAACRDDSSSSTEASETRSQALSQTATVTEMQPAVAFGGRAVAGSVSPSNASIAYVAAETGGVAGQSTFANSPKTTVYRNGQLVWGTEP